MGCLAAFILAIVGVAAPIWVFRPFRGVPEDTSQEMRWRLGDLFCLMAMISVLLALPKWFETPNRLAHGWESEFVRSALVIMPFAWVWWTCVSRLNSLKIAASWRRCLVLFIGIASVPLAFALPVSGIFLVFEITVYGTGTRDAKLLSVFFASMMSINIALGVLMRLAVPQRCRLLPQSADPCPLAETTDTHPS